MNKCVLIKNGKTVQFVGTNADCVQIMKFLTECDRNFKKKTNFKIVRATHQQFYEDLLTESKLFKK